MEVMKIKGVKQGEKDSRYKLQAHSIAKSILIRKRAKEAMTLTNKDYKIKRESKLEFRDAKELEKDG